ncbi:hypothetical protein NPIL_43911, partial [Nephila pilipes]
SASSLPQCSPQASNLTCNVSQLQPLASAAKVVSGLSPSGAGIKVHAHGSGLEAAQHSANLGLKSKLMHPPRPPLKALFSKAFASAAVSRKASGKPLHRGQVAASVSECE